MMDKKKIQLSDITKVNAFKTPEGYFERFTNDIMSQLPETDQVNSMKVNRWHRVRPWFYMAAAFAGIALIFRLFVSLPTSFGVKNYALEGLKLTSSSDIDDFYHYYEEGLARLAYDEALYFTDYNEDEDIYP